MKSNRIIKKARTGIGIIKREGILSLNIKASQKLQNRKKHHHTKKQIRLLVKHQDILNLDLTKKLPTPRGIDKESYTINWVMSPPGKGSGGHQNIYRFIKYLEDSGHSCRIYLYSGIDKRSLSEIKAAIGESYANVKAPMRWLDNSNAMEAADAIFATGWETAYPVFNSPLRAKRFYFVQDFEPLFYPIGSEHVLAENTYSFGFYGITAGRWLAQKLSEEYSMSTDFFDFGAETNLYKYVNANPRNEVFFYARPITARRGFELGIMALELFHKKHPEYIINLAGWDVSDYDIPFPYKNLRTLDLNQLSNLYNKCAVALILSLTNMSLLPLELLACGTIPVVNYGDNNQLVSDNPYIAYANSTPVELANKMSAVVERKDLPLYSTKAASSIRADGWNASGKKFVQIVTRELNCG